MRRRQFTFIVAAALSFAVEVSGHAPPGQASPPGAQPETTTDYAGDADRKAFAWNKAAMRAKALT